MNNRVVGFVLALLAFAASAAFASDKPDGRPLRVLFIGSSLTYENGLPEAFASVAMAADPRQVDVMEVAFPRAGLRSHWEGRARDRLKEGKWDYVMLQAGFDQLPKEYVRKFHEEITRLGAKTVLFGTWATRGDSRRQKELDEAFAKIAAETGALLAPVGPAWTAVAAKHGSSALYRTDDLHPSPMGTYVAACVFYSAIFGKAVPVGDTTGITRTAHESAWEAVRAAVK